MVLEFEKSNTKVLADTESNEGPLLVYKLLFPFSFREDTVFKSFHIYLIFLYIYFITHA